jgi:ATP-dependent exoDNAse (exonuclease V) beta subunit
VLAADHRFFAKANGSIHSNSQIKWLRADAKEPNEQHLAELSNELTGCAETARRQQNIPRMQTRENFGRRETGWIDRARQRAGDFVRTVSPSKFAAEEEVSLVSQDEDWTEIEPELRPPRIDNPATRYGVWWHDFAQRIPWLKVPSSWDEVFALHHPRSPDRARASREWRLLRERVHALPDFGSGWTNRTPVIRAELPFFWKMPDDRSLEGVVDLAFFDPEAGEWLIIDWKTNRIARDKIELLRAQYRPQLAAYCQAVKETTGHEVRAALYSTATGEFVRYEPQEMVAEWERLERLPSEKLSAELSNQLTTVKTRI